jgi:hypothetical protein
LTGDRVIMPATAALIAARPAIALSRIAADIAEEIGVETVDDMAQKSRMSR